MMMVIFMIVSSDAEEDLGHPADRGATGYVCPGTHRRVGASYFRVWSLGTPPQTRVFTPPQFLRFCTLPLIALYVHYTGTWHVSTSSAKSIASVILPKHPQIITVSLFLLVMVTVWLPLFCHTCYHLLLGGYKPIFEQIVVLKWAHSSTVFHHHHTETVMHSYQWNLLHVPIYPRHGQWVAGRSHIYYFHQYLLHTWLIIIIHHFRH